MKPEAIFRTGVFVVQESRMCVVALLCVGEGCAHHVDDAGEQVEALDVRCGVGCYA